MYYKTSLIFTIGIFILLLQSCKNQNKGIDNTYSSIDSVKVYQPQKEKLENLEVKKDAYNFFVIGDWGRNGDYNQIEVAEIMSVVAKKMQPRMIISTGDNFYPNGVASTSDPQWKSSFEEIYKSHDLNRDWYAVLGNHDYRGNIQAQIGYSNVSRRWNMPSKYYSFSRKLKDDSTRVKFVFLDTSPFEDSYKNGYSNINFYDTIAQMWWLDGQLNSTEEWKIVIGHHPLYTSGVRKDKKPYVRKHLEKFFELKKVDAYFAGHEHDLQHNKPKGKHTHHFVSGAGSSIRKTSQSSFTKFSKASPGFLAVSLYSDTMLVQAIDTNGFVIYNGKVINQR